MNPSLLNPFVGIEVKDERRTHAVEVGKVESDMQKYYITYRDGLEVKHTHVLDTNFEGAMARITTAIPRAEILTISTIPVAPPAAG